MAPDVDPDLYFRSNRYVISEQGKPPDFVLDVTSGSTATTDLGPKGDDYAVLGIPEYWRFDETGEFYGERLAGNVLWRVCTSPSRLSGSLAMSFSAAATCWTWTSGGMTASWSGTTPRAVATFDPRWRACGPGPCRDSRCGCRGSGSRARG